MKLLSQIVNLLPLETAYAHCDIPCGIYDPHAAQVGAHTIIRMTQMLLEVKRDNETKAEHDIARMTHVKEEHGHLIEDELGTLDNDYFKPEHHERYPELAELIKSAVKLSVAVRQGIDAKAANDLLEKVLQIAEIFYKTKNLTPVRVPSWYPTGAEMVVPQK